jgi:hypothetical protein
LLLLADLLGGQEEGETSRDEADDDDELLELLD